MLNVPFQSLGFLLVRICNDAIPLTVGPFSHSNMKSVALTRDQSVVCVCVCRASFSVLTQLSITVCHHPTQSASSVLVIHLFSFPPFLLRELFLANLTT